MEIPLSLMMLLALSPVPPAQGISTPAATTTLPDHSIVSAHNTSIETAVETGRPSTTVTLPEAIAPIQFARSVSQSAPSSLSSTVEAFDFPAISPPEAIAPIQFGKREVRQIAAEPQALASQTEVSSRVLPQIASPNIVSPNIASPNIAPPAETPPSPAASSPEISSSATSSPETSSPEAANRLSQTPSQTSDSQPAAAPKHENALFERFFGRSRNAVSQQINVPFFIENEHQGQLFVITASAQSPNVRLQAAPLLEKLKDLVRIDVFQQLSSAVDGEGYLVLTTLQQVGLEVSFDERKLEVRIQVPPTVRKTTVNTLGNLPPEAANAIHPSRVSGYLNFQGAEDFIWSGGNQQGGRQPMHLGIDGALNIRGWVLEGSAAFAEEAHSVWSRGDLRIVRDDPAHAIRYTVGEQTVPARGYQSGIPMLGFSAVRNFSIQPYRVTRPISRFEFFLEKDSTVDVFINNHFSQTLRLSAGPQDIRNLPLNAGVNDVQLVITDDLKQVQRLNFPAAVAAEQLAPGVQQFAYSLGFPTSIENGRRLYDWTQPTLSLAHRRGLTTNLTLGSYLQATPDRQLLGFEGIWSTPLGNLGWDMAISHDRELGFSGAARLGYELLHVGGKDSRQRSLRLALEYRGANFAPLGCLSVSNPNSLDISANYNQQIFGNINATLSGQYQIGRDDTPDAYSVGLGLSRSFKNGMNLNISFNHQHSQNKDDQRVSVGLFWTLSLPSHQSVMATATANTAGDPTAQVAWNFSSARLIDRLDGSVSLAADPNRLHLAGQLNYSGARADLRFSQDLLFGSEDMSLISNVSHLTFGTAIVFADGHFGWSHPINDSFALVIRRGNLRGRMVGVNPGTNGYTARADHLGSAVVSGLQPYNLSPLHVQVPNLPTGYDIGAQHYMLLPTYRSGTAIYVGTDATVFLRGMVLDEKGEAIALQAGEIHSLSEPDWQPITFFTNKAGRFAAPGLKPGKYELRFNTQSRVQLEIPAGQEGVYDAGTLQAQSH